LSITGCRAELQARRVMASDAVLIGRSLAGDAAAFMEMVCRHEVAIGAYLERRVGREVAEDLLGDVWVAAFESRRTYDQSYAEARPWLYTMALNRLRHYWRSRPAEDLVPDVTGLASGWDPWPAVDVRVDTKSVFRAALAGLRPDEREVLTLVAGEDLSVADAARVLGMPAGTARRLLHQARTALRNAPEVAALLIEFNSVKGSK
jgi:RNA polymerase sigma factor (sigma-70 family)